MPEEFNDLITLLPQYRFITFPRKGYPKANHGLDSFSENSTLTDDVILLGYSWGNVPALQFAFKNLKHVKAIIIVSPYLYPSQEPSIKLIFSVPLVGKIILKFLGKRFVYNLLLKSSSPMKVPLAYQRLAKILSEPQMLYNAITEKHPLDLKVLRKIAQENIPVVLVWGEKDLTSKEEEQILPIKNVVTNLIEIQLKDVGHAIPFTKPEALAEVINNFIHKLMKEKK